MLILIFFLITFGVANAYFTFDEEMLIILSTIIWVDAAGGLFKKFLDTELLHKVTLIKSKFVWFLFLKAQVLKELIFMYQNRLLARGKILSFNSFYVFSVLKGSLISFLQAKRLRSRYDTKFYLLTFGNNVHSDRLIKNLARTLATSSFSGIAVLKNGRPLYPVARYSSLLILSF